MGVKSGIERDFGFVWPNRGHMSKRQAGALICEDLFKAFSEDHEFSRNMQDEINESRSAAVQISEMSQ